MKPLPRVTFVLDGFTIPSPGQQLLDRFLIGYNSDGTFRVPGCEVAVIAQTSQPWESRVKEFGLKIVPNLNDARAVVFAGNTRAVTDLPDGSRCFVYGLLGTNEQAAREVSQAAKARGIVVRTGSATETAFRLPDIEFDSAAIRKALIVTTGPEPEVDALYALRSLIPSRLAFSSIRTLIWRDVWQTAYLREWSSLFAAAVSRSNTMQGDPEKDGRTQDIAGLKLVEQLAKQPRAWIVDHADGMQTAIFNLAGALEDLNFAVELAGGKTASAQLYRPPVPMQDHFSPLAEQIERFFRADAPEPSADLLVLPALYEKMHA